MTRALSERLAPDIFRLPVGRIRTGYYSDAYFNYTKALLEAENRHPHVIMQVFQRQDSILGGIDEAIAVLKTSAGGRRPDGSWEPGWDALEVRALYEGDAISPWETVMTIEGDYALFAHLETVYLGALARRTLVMRNVRAVVDAAAAPPARVGVGRHADRAGLVGRPPVARLHEPVVVAGGEEEDRLARRRLDDGADVAHHERAARQGAEVHGLEVGEEGVVALDRHDGLVRRDRVGLV